MRDRRNDILNNVTVFYDVIEENIFQKPHQNTERGHAPGYARTKASCYPENWHQFNTSTGPKEAVFQATRDLGKKKAPQPAYFQGKEKMASYWRFC